MAEAERLLEEVRMSEKDKTTKPFNAPLGDSSQHFDVTVVGAGICGLTLAYRLRQQGFSVLLLEAEVEPGGVMKTLTLNSAYGQVSLEAGPNTVPSSASAFLELADELGLSVIKSSPLAKNRYIYLKNKLRQVPDSPLAFLLSPLLSISGKFALLRDLYQPVCSQTDVSLGAFVKHRFGQEILENLVTPAVTGIYANDPYQMSVKASFPFLCQWEQKSGGVIKGALAALAKRKRESQKKAPKKQGKSPYALLSFDGGLQALPKAIAKSLENEIRYNTRLDKIEATAPGYRLVFGAGETCRTTALVLAIPAYQAAGLLHHLQVEAADLLNGIDYAPMVLTSLGFEADTLEHQWDGFGFLVPRRQNLALLGGIWCSALFPKRYPEALRVGVYFQGGAFHPEMANLSDEDIIRRTVEDLQHLYQQNNLLPVFTHVKRWPKAIPRYAVGHCERLAKIDMLLQQECPNLYLLGNYQKGVSLNDCVKSAQDLAYRIGKTLPKEKR